MLAAAIDIGTISVRLLVASVDVSGIIPLQQGMIITRLGEGVGRTGELQSAAIDRTLCAVRDFCAQARARGAECIFAVATSAARDARNGNVLLKRIRSETGVAVRIIPGPEEAELSFTGVRLGLAQTVPFAVVDVGGGSTELIGGGMDGIRYRQSIDAGAVRMTEGYLRHDPVDAAEYEAMIETVDGLLQPVVVHVNRDTYPVLTAVGGTATTAAAIRQCLAVYDPEKVHGFILSRADLTELIAKMKNLPLAARRQTPGLQPERADLVVAGMAIIERAMVGGGWDAVVISEADILHGIIWDNVQRMVPDAIDT